VTSGASTLPVLPFCGQVRVALSCSTGRNGSDNVSSTPKTEAMIARRRAERID
jgi:hypothetical protein